MPFLNYRIMIMPMIFKEKPSGGHGKERWFPQAGSTPQLPFQLWGIRAGSSEAKQLCVLSADVVENSIALGWPKGRICPNHSRTFGN